MKKGVLKRILNILFLVAVFSLTVWSVFRGQDLEQVLEHIASANLMYVVPAIACVIGFILGESVILYYLFRTLGTKVKMSHCCLYSFIGFFYSSITPSASGGQPMQVIAMRKDHIPVAVSSVVLVVVTIIYKLVLVMIGAVIMLLRPAKLVLYLEPVAPIIYLGMALNVVCIAVLLMLLFMPNLIRWCALKLLKLLYRIRLVRNYEFQTQRIDRVVGQYKAAADFFRNHLLVMFNVFVITLVQRCVLFFITWLTYRSFNLAGESMPVVVSLQAMISVAADMMPLPGGMGVSENMFLEIFQPIFGENLVLPGMVISRGISYYTQLIISGVMTLVSFGVIREKKEKGTQ